MPRGMEDMDSSSAASLAPPPLRPMSSGLGPPRLQANRSQAPSLSLNLKEIKFQGRRPELKYLKQLYREAVVGDCARGVLLFGDSGCGKTSLVLQFRQWLLSNIRNSNPLQKVKKKSNSGPGFGCSFLTTRIEESRSPFTAFRIAICQLCDQLIRQGRQDEIDLLQAMLDDEDIIVLHRFDARFREMLKCKGDGTLKNAQQQHAAVAHHDRDRLPIKLQKIFRICIQIIAAPEFPVVMFLDDMHAVDKDSAQILKSVLQSAAPGFLFIGCYRQTTPEIQILVDLENTTSQRIEGLAERDVNDIIASLLSRDCVETEDLSSVIWKKTGGNPFWVIQFLQMLQDNESLRYSFEKYKWVWDLRRIVTETNFTSNVVDIIAGKIQKLPLRTQEALKVASCLGSQFDIDVLTTVVASHHEMAKRKIKLSDGRMTFVSDEAIRVMKVDLLKSLQVAVKLLLLEVTHDAGGEPIYKFAHDRIRSAIYSLLPDGEERDGLHLLIGKLLYKLNAGGRGEEWMLMVATGQMNKASHLIKDRKAQVKLAELNLQAAQGAAQKSAFFLASEYLKSGMTMLRKDPNTWDDTYKLTLDSMSMLAEIQYIKGEHQQCRQLVNEILKNGKTLKDKLRASLVLIELDGSRENFDSAMASGYHLLEQLGIKVPQNPTSFTVSREFKKIKKLIAGMADQDFLTLPQTVQEEIRVGMKVMSLIAGYAYFSGRKSDLAMLGLSMLNLTVNAGMTDCACHGFAVFGVIVASMGDYKDGFRFGQLALTAFEFSQEVEYQARTYLLVHGFLHHLEKPFHQSLGPLMHAHQTGMDTGDTEYGLLTSTAYVGVYIFCGLTLKPLHDDIKGFQAASASYRQSATLTLIVVFRQVVEGLMGLRDNASDIAVPKEGNAVAIHQAWFMKMMMAYLFHNFAEAIEYAEKLDKLQTGGSTSYEFTAKLMYRCLIYSEQARMTGKSKYKSSADKIIKTLEQNTKDGNLNAHHMLCLCVAERASLSKKKSQKEVKELYDKAVLSASKTGFTQIAALSNERAGMYFHAQGDMGYAQDYLDRAVGGYALWGAKAKVKHLLGLYNFLEDVKVNETTSHLGRQRFSSIFADRHRDVQQATIARSSDDGSTDGYKEEQDLRQKGNVVRSLFSRNGNKGDDDLFGNNMLSEL